MRKTLRQKRIETVKLLDAIRSGQKHTKANAVLAPLSQAALISFTTKPDHTADFVWVTTSGNVWLEFTARELGIELTPVDPTTQNVGEMNYRDHVWVRKVTA